MEKVLSMKEQIQASAQRNALSRTYWAAVGSGPNKAAADEIRIKLSELCYKTISSDYVEDKKHIDLSSEPLIFVCAAGTRRSVIGDIIKDTAIFHSHKALAIVIADEHEDRFDPYSNDIIHVPSVSEHFAPILNTLVGHLWGYYAALTINEGSGFLFNFREDLQNTIDDHFKDGLDIHEIALAKMTMRHQKLQRNHQKKLMRYAKEMLHYAKKYCGNLVEAYRLSGIIYHMIEKDKKARMCFSDSISFGKSSGSRLELSRAYFETGNFLSDPNVKFR